MKIDTLSDGYDICQAADSFYGVYSGQAALQVTPDKIMYIDSEIISQAQVYNYETKKTGAVYDKDKLTGYDPYDFSCQVHQHFLGLKILRQQKRKI